METAWEGIRVRSDKKYDMDKHCRIADNAMGNGHNEPFSTLSDAGDT